MPEAFDLEKQEASISHHIFPVSAGMVGVCLTVIGLLNIGHAIRKINTIGDDFTAFNAVIFIMSCYLSYSAMKTKNRPRRLFLEKVADRVFLSGLFLMVVVCFIVVYAFSWHATVSR